MFYKILAASLVALIGVFVLNMNEQAHADREARKNARFEREAKIGKTISDGPAVLGERRLEDGIIRVIEVPRRSILGLEVMTCVLYVGQGGGSAISCGAEGTPVLD